MGEARRLRPGRILAVALVAACVLVGLRVLLRTPHLAPPLPCVGCGEAVRCEEIEIPTAFSLGWKHLNHRVSRIGFGPADPTISCAMDVWHAHMVGGDFSTGEVFSDRVLAQVETVRLERGEGASLGWVRVPFSIGPEGHIRVRHPVDSGALGFDPARPVTAVLGGFVFTTDVEQDAGYPDDYEPRLGYTMRGFGVDVRWDEQAARGGVLVEARFEPGAASDARFRADMNRAMQVARVGGWVDVALVQGPADDDHDATPLRVSVGQTFDRPYRWTTALEPGLTEEERSVLGAWGASAVGPAALSGFDLTLPFVMACERDRDCAAGERCTPDGMCTQISARPGDYLRRVAAGVEAGDDGRPARVVARASTATRAVGFRPLVWSMRLDLVDLGMAGAWEARRGVAEADAGMIPVRLHRAMASPDAVER